MKISGVILVLCYLINTASAQSIPYDSLLEEVKQSLDKIESFTANVEIVINVDFIKIPDKKAIVYFKKPDKISFKSADFMMIPKRGTGFTLLDILNQKYSAIHMGQKMYKNLKLEEYKIIPGDNKSGIVLATLLISSSDKLVHQMEIDTRKSGYFITDFEYGNNSPLPDSSIIKFEVNEFKLPLRFIGKINIDNSKIAKDEWGEVILKYSDYKINLDIEDDVFVDEIN